MERSSARSFLLPQRIGFGPLVNPPIGQALLPASRALLHPPLPCRRAVMRMHAAVGDAGLFLLVDIVDAEPVNAQANPSRTKMAPRSSPDARQIATMRP